MHELLFQRTEASKPTVKVEMEASFIAIWESPWISWSVSLTAHLIHCTEQGFDGGGHNIDINPAAPICAAVRTCDADIGDRLGFGACCKSVLIIDQIGIAHPEISLQGVADRIEPSVS